MVQKQITESINKGHKFCNCIYPILGSSCNTSYRQNFLQMSGVAYNIVWSGNFNIYSGRDATNSENRK